MVKGGLSSDFVLTNGSEHMRYSPIIRFANLYGRGNPVPHIGDLPTGMEGLGPGDRQSFGRGLLKSLEEERAEYRGIQRYRDADVGLIITKVPDEHKSIWTISIDPRRGYLMTRIAEDSPQRVSEAIVIDAERCANGGWFPKRSFYCVRYHKQPDRVLVREYRVTKITTEPPADELFHIDLPKGTGLFDIADAKTTFVLEAPMSVGLGDLPVLLDRAARAGIEDRALEARLRPTGASIWWWVAAGGILAAVCVIAVRRRWRNRPSGA
jgi:hypothetical protein